MADDTSEPADGATGRLVVATARAVARTGSDLLARTAVQALMRLPAREVLAVDASGHRHRINTKDQMGANLLLGRYRLPSDVLEHVRHGDWVVDCGANVGLITSQLCAAVGSGGRVVAVEPVATNLERLRALAALNDLPQLVIAPVAAGAEDGAATIGLPPGGRSGWASMTKSWDVVERVEVQVRRLDGLAELHGDGEGVSFVKLDVEGFEFEVLQGARTLLGEHRPVVWCEFNDVLLRDRGRSSNELLAEFASLGYRPTRPVRGRDLEGRVENLLLTP